MDWPFTIYAAGFVVALVLCGWTFESLKKHENPLGLAIFAAVIWPVIAALAAGELARKFLRRPAQGIEAATAGETRSGSTEGESPVRDSGCAQTEPLP